MTLKALEELMRLVLTVKNPLDWTGLGWEVIGWISFAHNFFHHPERRFCSWRVIWCWHWDKVVSQIRNTRNFLKVHYLRDSSRLFQYLQCSIALDLFRGSICQIDRTAWRFFGVFQSCTISHMVARAKSRIHALLCTTEVAASSSDIVRNEPTDENMLLIRVVLPLLSRLMTFEALAEIFCWLASVFLAFVAPAAFLLD